MHLVLSVYWVNLIYIFIQLFLIVTLFTEYAFQLVLELTSSRVLIPYLLVAAYGLKLTWMRETYSEGVKDHKKDFIMAKREYLLGY